MPGVTQYLTVDELLEFPLGVEWRNIPRQQPGGNTSQAASIQENWQALTNLIRQASGIADEFCFQTLAATLDTEEKLTETLSAGVNSSGYLWAKADNFPIISVQSFQYGYPTLGGTSWVVPTLSDVLVEGDLKSQLVYPGMFERRGRPPIRVQYSYLNGWVVTTLSAATAAGAVALPVADATGVVAGSKLHVGDGPNSEDVAVAGSWSPVQGPATVALAAGAKFAHAPVFLPVTGPAQPHDVSVGTLPPQVKAAVALVCKYLVEFRGPTGVGIAGFRAVTGGQQRQSGDEIPMEAQRILLNYRRVF